MRTGPRALVIALAALALALPTAAAQAAAPTTIGNGQDPSVFVDDAGTAHIVWWSSG